MRPFVWQLCMNRIAQLEEELDALKEQKADALTDARLNNEFLGRGFADLQVRLPALHGVSCARAFPRSLAPPHTRSLSFSLVFFGVLTLNWANICHLQSQAIKRVKSELNGIDSPPDHGGSNGAKKPARVLPGSPTANCARRPPPFCLPVASRQL